MINVPIGRSENKIKHNDDFKEMTGEADEIGEDAVNTINMMLYIKDWNNLSDSAQHELAKMYNMTTQD